MSTQPFEPKARTIRQSGPDRLRRSKTSSKSAWRKSAPGWKREAGVAKRETHQFKTPVEKPFTKEQRGRTTLLFGGLTWKHEKLVHGALEGLGYRAEAVPTPNVKAFQTGKEYGNNGQCNPTYFTVGNLVQYLQSLEEQGLTKQEIIDRYVFFTAGACGPCRFGMYEAEYRLALRNSGFDGFRVLLFQQSGGLSQSDAEAGLEMNLDFFLGILNALNCGDVMNEVAYAVPPLRSRMPARPTACSTKAWITCTRSSARSAVEARRRHGQVSGRLLGYRRVHRQVRQPAQGRRVHARRCSAAATAFNEIEIDRLRVKPIVKITGEFWAQTTEGDGNFNMFNFLQKRRRAGAGGAHRHLDHVHDSPGGAEVQGLQGPRRRRRAAAALEARTSAPRSRSSFRQKVAKLKLAEAIFKGEYHKIVDALGGIAHHLADQYELQRLGPSLLQLARRRRRRPPGSRQEYLLLEQRPGAHGAVGEALRLHAVHAIGWRAIGRGFELQGHDLPAGGNLRRRRDQRSLAACRWRWAKPRTRPRRNSPKCWSGPA